MAVEAATFTAYDAVGNREDLSDVIYRIDPTDTPFMTACEREKATAVNHEWQTQALAAVDTGNAKLEGDAEADGFLEIFHGVPGIGGRYSALSNFGMVPAAVMGIDFGKFLDNAHEMVEDCAATVPVAENPGVV